MTAGSASNAASGRLTRLLRYFSPPSPQPHGRPTPPTPAPTTTPPASRPTPPSPHVPVKPSSPFRSTLSYVLSYLPSLSSLPGLESLSRQSLEREALSSTSPYDSLLAHVERRTSTLGKEEADYINRRRPLTLPHLHNLAHPSSASSPSLPLHPSAAPSVAICLSGGGYRAMLGSLAALSSLDSLGVLSASTYISGLSGSTWAMSQIYSAPASPPPSSSSSVPPLDFPFLISRVREQVALPLFSRQSPTLESLLPVIKRSLLDRLHFSSQSLTITDVLSWFISRRILSSIPPPPDVPPSSFLASLTLSGQREALSSASLPFPLYTAITSPEQIQFEFSPYSVGSWELSAFIPTWAFNRPFQGGKSTSAFPREPHLSTLLSVFSSAHCTDLASQLGEMALQMKAAERVKSGVKDLVERMRREWRLQDVHPFEAIQFNSPLHSLPLSTFPLPPSLTSKPTLPLMDAGLSFNFPLVPLVQPHRGVDVIVLVDFTSPPEAMSGAYLHTARRYCRAHGLPLPEWVDGVQPLGYLEVKEEENVKRRDIREGEGIPTKPTEVEAIYRACHSRVTVFRGEGSVPTIVYIPLLSNENFDKEFCPRKTFEMGGFTTTINLVYSPKESQMLMGLVSANLEECEGAIRGAITDKWREKQQRNATINTHNPLKKSSL